ncbi:MAG: XRE family transcriptional [Geobacteraceae bacterium]|nr:MAG: XRE family transcriptional [Geobacteraceae bacterium]
MTNTLNIEKLSQQAEALGHNQSSIAKALSVSRETVSQWFKQEKYPRPDKLLKLARLLDLSFSELVIKLTAPNEPVVAFRKKGAHKITPEYVEQAKDMGRILEVLVPYLPFDDLALPATLRRPVNEYEYVHKAARRVREEIGVHEGDEIHFEKLIDFFSKLHAVLIPVLWAHKDKHENALHIYLPDSLTTWIYLNLDCKLHDFKFWMSHELGHVLAPQLQGDEGEDFAEAFAGALLIPQELAAREYEALHRLNIIGKQINRIKETADRLVVSPLTVYYEINKYAEFKGTAKIDLDSDNEIHKATSNFNKSYKPVSEILFGTKEPSASRYIACAKEAFNSPFFDILKKYLKAHRKSASFVQSTLNIPLLDAQSVYGELCSAGCRR